MANELGVNLVDILLKMESITKSTFGEGLVMKEVLVSLMRDSITLTDHLVLPQSSSGIDEPHMKTSTISAKYPLGKVANFIGLYVGLARLTKECMQALRDKQVVEASTSFVVFLIVWVATFKAWHQGWAGGHLHGEFIFLDTLIKWCLPLIGFLWSLILAVHIKKLRSTHAWYMDSCSVLFRLDSIKSIITNTCHDV